MVNELLELNTEQIIVQQGFIEWSQFEDLKEQALELAENIRTINVDPENIKESKKLLAEVNKRCKELDSRRIKIKNVLLQPYSVFESQVKEIVGIVKEADEIVRDQVKQLEEEDRQEKQRQLNVLFNLRLKHYSFQDLFSFDDFLQQRHLNKTVSIEAVEKEMIEFLEKVTKDLKAIETMNNAEDILGLYLEKKDLAAALTLQAQNVKRKEQIEASKALQRSNSNEEKIAYLVSVTCYDQKELKLLELLLADQNYDFTVDKITN